MSSVIFIGSPSRSEKKINCAKQILFLPPYDLMNRIVKSFVPSFPQKQQRVYVDLQGPLLGFFILTAFVTYGNNMKNSKIGISPVAFICAYTIIMPILCYLLTKIGQSAINLFETLSLVGYAYYGHIVTLLASFICFQEKSNFFFFLCLIVFGGLSTLRMALVFLGTIPIPAARLLICTTISVVNILSLIFLHFAYMHRTFVYRG